MFNVLLLFLFLLIVSATQAQPDPNKQESEIVSVPGGAIFHRWYGHAGRTYFIQVSDPNNPLIKWNWIPAIESGNNEEISHDIGGTAPQVFYRLKPTDLPIPSGKTPDTTDFDLDGLSNLDEIVPPPPLVPKDATDPLDPDSDDDGLTDGYERTHGLDPNDPGTGNPDNGPNGDPDGDGLTNAEELLLGTFPDNPNSDGDKLDGKDLLDGEDAVPLDAEINWKKAPESKYVWIEQMATPVDQSGHPIAPVAVNSTGLILFEKFTEGSISYQAQVRVDTRKNVLWDSAVKKWVTLSNSSSQTINIDGRLAITGSDSIGSFKDINDAGTVSGIGDITVPMPVADADHKTHGILSGMVWKKSTNPPTTNSPTTSPLTYDAPTYYIHHTSHSTNFRCTGQIGDFSHPEVSCNIGIDNSINVTPYIQVDSAPNLDESVWMIHDGITNPSVLDIRVRQLSEISLPGGILDKNRALCVIGSGLYLKDQNSVHLVTTGTIHAGETDIVLAPVKKTDNSERLWIAAGSTVRLEKRAGGTGSDRWHTPPSMFLGADFLNSSGIAVKRKQSSNLGTPSTFPPRLWRNGKYSTLDHHVSKPSTVEITDVIDIASNGIILVTAIENGVVKTGLLLPVEVVDKNGVSLSELKVGKMYPNVLTGNGLNGDPVNVDLDKDEDRFFVRVKDADSLGSIKMKFETVDNAESMYNDDATEYTLESKDGYATTKSLVLVSDDVDDNHLVSTGGAPDNSPDDRTHLIQLGGNFKISAIKIGTGDWVSVEVKLPVKKKKTVRVQFVNCTYGIWGTTPDPCWDPIRIAWMQRKMQQRYAQVGVEFDFQPVLAGPWVSNGGSMDDDEILALNITTGKIVFPKETKDIIDHGPPNDLHNTLMIYLVSGLDSFRGVASPPKYVATADNRFKNKAFLAQYDFKDFTSSHEALHVLSDAAHDAPTFLDFATESADIHTIWTVPSVAQADRRMNGSIGSTKRISRAQDVKIQSSPLAH